MVKAMASSSAEWKHVSAFVSIFWLTSIVSVACAQNIELKIWSSGPARCGENLALLCNASSLRSMSIRKFIWVRNKTLCEYIDNKTGHDDLCERKNETSLILNLINITQADEGEYICKLRAKEGTKEENFSVTIQKCPINPPSDIPKKRVNILTPTGSSGSLVRSECIVVGIVMVNLMMYR